MMKKGRSRQVQIYESLKREMERNKYGPGDYLPTVRELAKRFSTSITPVYQAINRLAEEGYVSLVHGSGIMRLDRSGESVSARRKPVIDFLGTTKHFDQNEPPQRSRLITASSDWLLWGLTHSKEVRVSVTQFPFRDNAAFHEALTESIHSDSEVVTFSDPEHYDKEAIRLLNEIHKAGKNVVCLANCVDLPQFDRVRSDFYSGSYALTQHFLEKGHTSILCFHTSYNNWYESQKQKGYLVAIQDWNDNKSTDVTGLTHPLFGEAQHKKGLKEADWSVEVLKEILDEHPVTAILATSDASVLYLRCAAYLLGREDIEIAGYDQTWNELYQLAAHAWIIKDFPETVRYSEPPISVEVNAPLLGCELAKLAIRRALGDLPPDPQTVLIPQVLQTKPELSTLEVVDS